MLSGEAWARTGRLPVSRPDTIPTNKRQWIVGGTMLLGYGGSLAALSQAWYRNYPRSAFHTFNDSGEWLQMDKIGHAWSAYTASRLTAGMWQWAGMKRRAAALIGAGSSLAYLLSVEYLDGRSAEWGWSWADVAADAAGTGLFASQELMWQEQKIRLRFSAHRIRYEPGLLRTRADALFGKSLPERLLKDYNAQTYWLSTSLKTIFPSTALPPWLGISVGYGAAGMFGGYRNLAYDESGAVTFDRRDITRYRQWYLAPDIDLSRIPVKSPFLHAVFSALGILKFPTPALEYSRGSFHLRGLVF